MDGLYEITPIASVSLSVRMYIPVPYGIFEVEGDLITSGVSVFCCNKLRYYSALFRNSYVLFCIILTLIQYIYVHCILFGIIWHYCLLYFRMLMMMQLDGIFKIHTLYEFICFRILIKI